MLAATRRFAKSWVAAILIGLLIVSFAVFGINDIFTGNLGDQVIKAGDRVVTSTDFRREYDRYRKGLEQQAGQPITPEMAAANRLDQTVLNGLATREAFSAVLHKIGIRPADELLVAELAKIPAFFDQVSGRFDKQTYEQRLAENGLTPELFDQSLRDDMASDHFAKGIANGLRVPRAYSAMAAIYGMEGRDIAWFAVPPSPTDQPPAPTDAQLTAFMTENAAQLTRPELRVLTLVSFSPAQLGQAIAVDPAELQKRYDFRKDTLSTPETRTLAQVPAKDQATAQQIITRLGRGEEPAAVARSLGVEAITYVDKPRTAIADRKVGEAAFRLAQGQVAPVQGDLGPAVVAVAKVTPGRLVSLEEARPMLEAEVRKDAAAERVYALTQAYEEAQQGGMNMAEAAQKAGVSATTLGPVSKEGRDALNQPVAGLNPKIIDQAFALPAGGESELVEAGNGEYFAVRVERITPPALPPLAEIRGELARVWILREVAKRMEARAEALADRVRKGETVDAVASSSGQSATRITGLTRQGAQQQTTLSRDLLGAALSAKPGDVVVARAAQFGFAVARIEKVSAGEGPTLARAAEEARGEMSFTIFRELADSAQAYARTKLKVRADIANARAAVGMEPLPAPGGGAPAK